MYLQQVEIIQVLITMQQTLYTDLTIVYIMRLIWFYPTNNSTQVNASVVYNFVENTWTTMSLTRTTYSDAQTYDKPYATKWLSTATPTFPNVINGVTNTYGACTYYEHEVGVNEVSYTGVKTAIPAYVESGDFDLDIEGDGQYLMKINRFIPDFKILTWKC
jgi:hypothetical protein